MKKKIVIYTGIAILTLVLCGCKGQTNTDRSCRPAIMRNEERVKGAGPLR